MLVAFAICDQPSGIVRKCRRGRKDLEVMAKDWEKSKDKNGKAQQDKNLHAVLKA